MPTTRSLSRLARPLLVTAALVGSAALVLPAPADAAVRNRVTTAALLTVEDVRAAGLPANAATLDLTGDVRLNDAGTLDYSCLFETTMRGLTGAEPYPARGTGRGYADGTWTSTVDENVTVTESVAQGRTRKATDRYVATLARLITRNLECHPDPEYGYTHAPVRHVVARDGSTADYYAVIGYGGGRDGSGVAVVRDGTRFGIVSVFGARDASDTTLRKIATAAAQQLR